jgi:hypothetical protein
MILQFIKLYTAYAAYLEKIIHAAVGAALHDPLRQGRANTWKGIQFFQRGRVDVDYF